jgi:hypothetical protein
VDIVTFFRSSQCYPLVLSEICINKSSARKVLPEWTRIMMDSVKEFELNLLEYWEYVCGI